MRPFSCLQLQNREPLPVRYNPPHPIYTIIPHPDVLVFIERPGVRFSKSNYSATRELRFGRWVWARGEVFQWPGLVQVPKELGEVREHS